MSARRKSRSRSVMVPASKAGEPAIAIPGKAVEKEAKKGSNGFKKGGMVDGKCPPGRMDKAPRKASGGGVTMRGRSPFSSAAKIDTSESFSKATKADH
jgi:hypothetical protein